MRIASAFVFLLNIGVAVAASQFDTGVFAVIPGAAALLAMVAFGLGKVPRSRARTVVAALLLCVSGLVAVVLGWLLIYIGALAGAHVMS